MLLILISITLLAISCICYTTFIHDDDDLIGPAYAFLALVIIFGWVVAGNVATDRTSYRLSTIDIKKYNVIDTKYGVILENKKDLSTKYVFKQHINSKSKNFYVNVNYNMYNSVIDSTIYLN